MMASQIAGMPARTARRLSRCCGCSQGQVHGAAPEAVCEVLGFLRQRTDGWVDNAAVMPPPDAGTMGTVADHSPAVLLEQEAKEIPRERLPVQVGMARLRHLRPALARHWQRHAVRRSGA